MSNASKLLNLTKNLKGFCRNVVQGALQKDNIGLKTNSILSSNHCLRNTFSTSGVYALITAKIHTSTVRHDLMEFFDHQKNWAENEVKVGRAWNKEELRIKSNKELHQLWYVLLKERNMLLTMEHECNEKMELFPSPERIDKVKISMNNLETVVRERNKAYYLLETGTTGERPTRLVANALGINHMYRSSEHALPPFMNLKFIKSRSIGYSGRAVRKFLLFYREKLYNEKRKAKNRSRNEVMMLLRRNPHMDVNALRRNFPNVDIEKLQKYDKIRGHYVPKVDI